VRSGVAHLLPCVPHKGCVNSGSGIIIRQVPAVSGQAEENTSGESRTRHSGARRALHRPIFPAKVTQHQNTPRLTRKSETRGALFIERGRMFVEGPALQLC